MFAFFVLTVTDEHFWVEGTNLEITKLAEIVVLAGHEIASSFRCVLDRLYVIPIWFAGQALFWYASLMIVTTKNLFEFAYKKFAIGAYNINNLKQAG